MKGATGEVQWTVSPTASSAALPVPPAAPALGAHGYLTTFSAVPAPSISAGDLDAPGLPRDAYGRALLIAAIAMAADLLAPWVDRSDQPSMAPAQAGLPMLAVVVVLALAVAPLLRPSFRARPALAVLPVVVGGMFLSLSLATWGIVTYTALQMSRLPQQFAPDGTLVASPTIGPGVGLYLFILGSAVLIVTGYHLFLQAAWRAAPAVLERAPVAGVVAAMSAPPYAASAPYAAPDSEGAAYGADVAVPPSASGDSAAESRASGEGDKQSSVVLPGSASWHEAPPVPAYNRPSPLTGGWQRQPRTRR